MSDSFKRLNTASYLRRHVMIHCDKQAFLTELVNFNKLKHEIGMLAYCLMRKCHLECSQI